MSSHKIIVDTKRSIRQTERARSSTNGAIMNLKSAIASLFETTITAQTSANEITESADPTLFLGLEAEAHRVESRIRQTLSCRGRRKQGWSSSARRTRP